MLSSSLYTSKERNTRSVIYTGTNFVVVIVVTLVVEDVKGLVVVVVVLVVEAVLLAVEAVVVLVVEASDVVDVLVVLPVVVLNEVEEGINEVNATEVVVFGPVFIAALVIFVMRAENAVVGLVDIWIVLRVLFSKAVDGVAEVEFKIVDVIVVTVEGTVVIVDSVVDIPAVLIVVLLKGVEKRVVEVNEEAVGLTIVETAKLLVDVPTSVFVTTFVSVAGAVEVATIGNSGIRIYISV